jgi:hypothetical protein
MKLQAREIAIDASLTSAKVERHSCHAGRYHLITDLARKGPRQISLFLDRINKVLAASNASSQHSTHTAQSAQARAERVELSLITVLAIDDADLRSPPFPLFDFLGVQAITNDGGSDEAYGVMLSTYIHDLDRIAIDQLHERSDDFNDSRQLVDSLFFPSRFNSDEPPFCDKYPVFAFPSRPTTAPLPAATSHTDRYMHCLGFDCTIVHRPQGKALRGYTHHCDSKTRVSLAMNSAILAVGQVCAEMVEPSLYRQLDCSPTTLECRPQPFDRSMFNATLKQQQKQSMQQWLTKHEHLLDRSPRTSSQVNQAGSPVISSN